MFSMGFPELFIILVSFIPALILFGVIIYLIVLITRLVKAVERIADKIDGR